MNVQVTSKINVSEILRGRGFGPDNRARKFLASEIKRLSDPYVPMQQGTLKNSASIASDGSAITYPGPYAHYQYVGEVWGPNIPITKGGDVVGYYSKAPKHPTGRRLNYHGGPMRGKQWDRRMMADHRGDLESSMANYVGGAGE